jgi:hypothetical protein
MNLFSQKSKSTQLGRTTLEELKMTVYKNDSTAHAVVLYEHGNFYIDQANDYNFRTDFYFRIKILNKNAFDLATINLVTYKKENIQNIRAKTYNISNFEAMEIDDLQEKDIFKKERNENYDEISFTLPNIKEGSIIEYSYSVISPYSKIEDWKFQSNIPKIKSEFDAAILGNYRYNIRLVGFAKLDKNEGDIKKNCVDIPGLDMGACAIVSFGMDTIAAFKEESYMTSRKNFESKMVFDLKSYIDREGLETKYTTTWKAAEKNLKNNFLDNQISKRSFFKRNIPENILAIENTLERAKKVYTYIQKYYNWNGMYWNGGSDIRVREAFEEKSGSVADLNLSLYNALNAAEIQTYAVMLSTRANGLPSKLYPVTSDFNYMLVKAVIDGKEYFLDATNKFTAFGQVPESCLNGEARVLDFDEVGYWQEITQIQKTNSSTKVQLQLNENNDFEGKIRITRTGYAALDKRESIALLTKEAYLENLEGKNDYLLIDTYDHQNLHDSNKGLIENFNIRLENDVLSSNSNTLRINPFILGRSKENPFKLKERNYPVDFGYPQTITNHINISIPEGYTVSKLPERLAITLPNKGGMYLLDIKHEGQKIVLFSKFKINKSIFSSTEYYYLKEFYKQIIEAENNFIEITLKN